MSRRLLSVLVATGLLAGLGIAAPGPPGAAAAEPPPDDGGEVVTLITGDRVRTGGPGGTQVLPGPGREQVGFATFGAGEHEYVIPADAAKLVASGALDRRLFDVAELTRSGYADASMAELPLLVGHSPGRSAPASVFDAAGATVTRELSSVDATAVRTAKNATGSLWNGLLGSFGDGVSKVWLDGKRQATLDRSTKQIGAPAAWDAGFTGQGVKVAVVDSGVDQTHPDLADREVAEANFSGAPDNVDHHGHGTHVASTVAGTGAKSGGTYRGVADGAQILDVKVLDDRGFGQESGIIAGMEWAAEHGADIANISLGGPDSDGVDPLEEAVNRLSEQTDTLFVVAAGNSGPGSAIQGTVGSPGSADAALTVGAVDRDESIADFSSTGPRVGDSAIKPDITAPGVGIVAALHTDGAIGEPVEPGYTALSGTSMAAPHVAGAAALLASQHPDWTGEQLKATLTASAASNAELSPFQQGSGRVDVARAMTQTVTSEQTSLSLGTVAWPHDDDQPVGKELTYRNTGTADLTLALSVDAKGPNGNPAEGLFTLSATEVTVPAGGTAKVTVTGDVKAGSTDGQYSGAVLATSKDTVARTPVAINREVESYDVTFTHVGRDGNATAEYSDFLVNLDTGDLMQRYEEDGTVVVRVPKGRYMLDTIISVDSAPDAPSDWLLYPNLTVDGPATIDLDARAAKPLKVTPTEPAAELVLANVTYLRLVDGEIAMWGSLRTPSADGLRTAQLGPDLPAEELTSGVHTQWVGEHTFHGLAWYQKGRIPTGFEHVVEPEELATVHASYSTPVSNPDGASVILLPRLDESTFLGATAAAVQVALPSERTEYYTSNVEWSRLLVATNPDTGDLRYRLSGPPRRFEPGQTYEDPVNRAVFGPVLTPTAEGDVYLWREADTIEARLPLFGDSAGNTGSSIVDSAVTKLYRDGELVGESSDPGSGSFEVAHGDAEYQLSTEAVRSKVSDVSTKVSATWTFHSDTAQSQTPLPVSVIRFLPELDDANSAPGGGPFSVPFVMQPQGGGEPGTPKEFSAEVSYDGGTTWAPATVAGSELRLEHPADGTVSLRAKATDGDGNTVEQTIVNAYKLG